MKHLMPELPYEQNALAPKMSEETLQFHYGKHLQSYVDNLNKLLPGSAYEESGLEHIICEADGPIFNNAAQVWNHTFFFESLSPVKKEIGAELKHALEVSFGSVEKFKELFLSKAASLFGAGWVWLVVDSNKKLSIIGESNAGNPLSGGYTPLLTIDVWEHAYYIDYRNRRPDYLQAVWELVDWDRVAERYKWAVE